MKLLKRILVLSMVLVLNTNAVYAQSSSANFEVNQDRAETQEYDAGSANYKIKAEIGHPGVGQSTSPNYVYDHGTIWMRGASVSATIQWAIPELRVGAAGTNDDSEFFLTVRTANNADDVVLWQQNITQMMDDDGTYSAPPIDLTGISPGVYDIGIKTQSHLTRVLDDVTLVAGNNVLNFSQADNSAPKGAVVLDSGDVSGDGLTPDTLGDDVVNSVDISIIFTVLDNADLTGNGIRSNLNQDVVVNSVDLSMMLDNLDQNGDN